MRKYQNYTYIYRAKNVTGKSLRPLKDYHSIVLHRSMYWYIISVAIIEMIRKVGLSTIRILHKLHFLDFLLQRQKKT